VLLLLGQTRFAVLFNEQTGEFTSALAARDERASGTPSSYCLGLLVMAVPIYAFYYFVRDKLGIHWRRWLTDRFLDSYFSHRQFYELNANAAIDNPDQRIAEDINTFTQRSLYFLLILIGACCNWSPSAACCGRSPASWCISWCLRHRRHADHHLACSASR
jgi:putative ATP-binding cassette transporter